MSVLFFLLLNLNQLKQHKMNKVFLLSFISLFSFFTINAQDVYWPLSVEEINTGSNDSYLIQSANIDGSSIVYGYVFGAFFTNDEGNLQCAGFVNCGSGTVQMAIMGDDTTTEEKDGFEDGDEITWLAYGNFSEETYTATVTFSTEPPFGTNTYNTNGLNIIGSFNVSSTILGCMESSACNYNANATEDDSSCTYAEANENCDGTCIDTDGDLVCDIYEVLGCTDFSACNYNTNATEEDDSCTYPELNIECGETAIIGCIDATACNYNELATVVGQCFFPDTGCQICSGEIDGSGVVLSNDDDDDGVCNQDEINGCTDSLYTEFSEIATEDDGTCEILEILGCTDTEAFNYNMNANTSIENCLFDIVVDFNPIGTNNTTNYSVTIETIEIILGSSEIAIGDIIGGFYIIDGQLYCAGFTEWTGSDISLNLWMDNPSTEEIDGVTEDTNIYWVVQQDETLFNYLVDFTLNQEGGYTFVTQMTLNTTTIIGCMEDAAFNYNEDAFINDGACVDIMYGCLDTEACNYTEEANTEDNTCYYITANIPDFEYGQPLTVVTDAENPTFVWLLDDVEQEGETTSEFTPYINGVYAVVVTDDTGCVTSDTIYSVNIGLEEYNVNQLNVYPNPAQNYTEIHSSIHKIETLKIVSITGKLLQEYMVDALIFKIDRNNLANGIYFLKATINNRQITKQIVFK